MSFLKRPFWTIEEVAARCSAYPADVLGWAVAGSIHLSCSIPATRSGNETVIGIVTLPATDLGPLLWPNTTPDTRIRIHRVKRTPQDADWLWITDPVGGFEISRSEIFVMTDEAERVRRAQEDQRPQSHGSPPTKEEAYDWHGLTLFLFQRVYHHGIPASQAEMIRESEAWFARRSATGDTPDESSIRRRIKPYWQALQEAPPELPDSDAA